MASNSYAKYSGLGGGGGGSITTGNLTDVGTDGIVITGGTGAVVGSGTSLAQHVADSTHNGYLSSTDWNTFNGKQSTLTVGTLDGQTANAAGAAIASNQLFMQSADATHPGLVNNAAQTFSGLKTIKDNAIIPNLAGSASSAGNLTLESTTHATKGLIYFGAAQTSAFDEVNGRLGINTASPTRNLTINDASGNTYLSFQANGTNKSLFGTDITGDFVYFNLSLSQYGLVQNSSGQWAIGRTAPTPSAWLTLQAGTASAGTAPLKITSGTKLSSVEAGAIENDGAHLYYTSDTPTRLQLATLTDLGSYLPLAGGTMSGAIDMASHKVTSVTDPTSAQDAATKNYVDTVASGLQPIEAVSVATTGSNLVGTYNNGASGVGATYTITATGAFTLDGTTPAVNSRILLKDQSSGFQNGVYNLTVAGTTGVSPVLTRSSNYNTANDMNAGGLVPVINGTINAQTSWLQTATITTVGSDSLVYVEWTANPASYLLKANNLSDVASKTTSFNNLSPMTTSGDVIYGGASGTGTRLAKGSDGQVLTLASGLPSWAAVAVPNFAVTSAQTTTYAIQTTDTVVVVNPSASFSATLPTAVGVTGKQYMIKNIKDDVTKVVTLATTSSQTIDGVTTRKLSTLNECWTITSDGANWQVLNHKTITPWRNNLTFTFNQFGTTSNSNIWWRRVGDSIEVKGTITSGTPGSSTASITLPTGIAIDSTKYSATSNVQSVGVMYNEQNTGVGANTFPVSGNVMVLFYDGSDTATIYMSRQYVNSALVKQAGNDFSNASTNVMSVEFYCPVSGWDE